MKYERGKSKIPMHARVDPFIPKALDFFARKADVSRSQLVCYCIQQALPKDLIPNDAVRSNRHCWNDYRIEAMRKALRSTKNKAEFQELQ